MSEYDIIGFRMSMISLLFYESEANLRMSVNNNDIIQMHLGYG